MKKSGSLFQLLVLIVLIPLMFPVNSYAQIDMISTLSAGVGEEDREEHPGYTLKIVTFVSGGPYLANVDIKITDVGKGELIHEGNAGGPWYFVDLPVGQYSIKAVRVSTGDEQNIIVSIDDDAQQKSISLMFPDR